MSRITIHCGDNLDVLRTIADGSVRLIYIDPPFNTGVKQLRSRFRTEAGGGRVAESSYGYDDRFDDFMGFLRPRIEEARRVLAADGSLFIHLDFREIHYCKVMTDEIFGRASFINEIIWAYDYGARSRTRWSCKHDTILWYARNPADYVFNYDAMDRIPYMAPGLAGPEKAARGKTPTDVWWHTIVSPNSREKTGYATQKPLGIVKRIIRVHSNEGDLVMDFFAGSGTFGEGAAQLGRDCILADSNPDAIAVMKRRLAPYDTEWIGCDGIAEAPAEPPLDHPEDFASDEPEGFTQPLAPMMEKGRKKTGGHGTRGGRHGAADVEVSVPGSPQARGRAGLDGSAAAGGVPDVSGNGGEGISDKAGAGFENQLKSSSKTLTLEAAGPSVRRALRF